ncbi:DnaJ domain-containing protein [Nitrosopumilus sp. S6]
MRFVSIFLISAVLFLVQSSHGQEKELDMDLEVTDEEKIILFGGFTIAVIGLFLFLARDIILRRKTSYDKEELESKKDKTHEKYQSDWGDDYEEIGKRRNTIKDKEFREAVRNDTLPNYYEVLGVSRYATQEEIKKSFRELAKKTHPDKTKKDSEEEMSKLNKAYEVLSDEDSRERYDRYFVD